MAISVFDLFSIGIGPSSSHTVGPMVAGSRFIDELKSAGQFDTVARVSASLHDGLAGFETAVVLYLFQSGQFIRFTPRANGTVTNGTIRTILGKLLTN